MHMIVVDFSIFYCNFITVCPPLRLFTIVHLDAFLALPQISLVAFNLPSSHQFAQVLYLYQEVSSFSKRTQSQNIGKVMLFAFGWKLWIRKIFRDFYCKHLVNIDFYSKHHSKVLKNIIWRRCSYARDNVCVSLFYFSYFPIISDITKPIRMNQNGKYSTCWSFLD